MDVDPNAKVSYKDEVAWTKKRVAEDLRWLQERVGAGTKLPAGVWAAVASWMYNVGRSAAARSTLVRRMEQGRWDQIAPELRRWVYVTDTRTGTKIRHPVLIARREAEATLVERSLAAWRGAGEDDGMRAPHGTIEAERIPALATDAGRAAILTTVAGSSAAVLERMVSSASSSALQWGVFLVVVVMVVV
ncbi:MAG: glycoside hydrolase family protein, partial [Thermomicrobium sp.]|nr:glycoside hydrolase family protein [Thermomicrobium sp.]